jgi:hypothetical protein
MHGETVGQSLKHQGLEELAEWTRNNQHPAITGLIVNQESRMPGLGYFELFNRDETDFDWWNQQIRDSIGHDWGPLLSSTSFVGTVADAPTPEAIDLGPVDRVQTTAYRILRDTALARRVKMLHKYRCQVCGNRIELPGGYYYAESHHVQPLGNPHDGPDVIGNILCLCPNHHAELDYGVKAIALADLRTAKGHRVESRFVDFHNDRVRKLWDEAAES